MTMAFFTNFQAYVFLVQIYHQKECASSPRLDNLLWKDWCKILCVTISHRLLAASLEIDIVLHRRLQCWMNPPEAVEGHILLNEESEAASTDDAHFKPDSDYWFGFCKISSCEMWIHFVKGHSGFRGGRSFPRSFPIFSVFYAVCSRMVRVFHKVSFRPGTDETAVLPQVNTSQQRSTAIRHSLISQFLLRGEGHFQLFVSVQR